MPGSVPFAGPDGENIVKIVNIERDNNSADRMLSRMTARQQTGARKLQDYGRLIETGGHRRACRFLLAF